MTQPEMRRLISDAGYEPVQRRTLYDACQEACCAAPIPTPKEHVTALPAVGSAPALDTSVASA
jgi:hypothetical protein